MIDKSGHPALLQFANAVLEVNFLPEECRGIGSVTEDMQIMGVVVYSRWTKHNCEMSVASVTPRFMTRAFLREVFGYPLNVLAGVRQFVLEYHLIRHHLGLLISGRHLSMSLGLIGRQLLDG